MVDQDTLIIERVRRGEIRAYAELIDRHKDRAMTVALRMLKNREDAEEAVQDAFVRAFRGLQSFEGRSSFSTWLYRIVFNVCSTALDKRLDERLSNTGVPEDQSEEPPAPEGGPDVQVEKREFEEIVQEEVDRLPPLYAGILSLFLIEDMSYDGIADVTGLPLGTVKIRLFRARALLRNAIVRRLGELKPALRAAASAGR